MQNVKNTTYIKKATGQERSRLVGAVVFPIAIFFLSIFAIGIFKNFGKLLMAPMIGVMWAVGAGCALYMPAQRKSIIKETLTVIATYNGTLLGLWKLIAITSGVSSQMLMATFGQPLATATGNTVPGFLQNALYLSSAMIPLGFLGMEFKRILTFKRSQNKQKTMERLRGIRE